MAKRSTKKTLLLFVAIFCTIFIAFYLYSFKLNNELIKRYEELQSVVIIDRNGKEICIKPNAYGNYMRVASGFPQKLKKFVVQKEDKYFSYHIGFNPISILKATLGYLELGKRKASSTITQQLVKMLLHQELERNIKNKITETLYAVALELHNKKDTMLEMYLNSIYLGNAAQGVEEASRLYFGTSAFSLNEEQLTQILATIPSPNDYNPAQKINAEKTSELLQFLKMPIENIVLMDSKTARSNMKNYSHVNTVCFEYSSFPNAFAKSKKITIDSDLTEKIRALTSDTISILQYKNANNAAVVVIKLPENEIISLVGSVDPNSLKEGDKIDMTRQPRAIGSTIKPFIYLLAFEKNLRPYTVVDDREYKYITALGFPLYPKNYDWKYRGEVTLHYALSNSLNVPAVKVLEYAGLDTFYSFLKNDLEFIPIQPLESYQLGIALGALEMNLLDLSHYFTIFPSRGMLYELTMDNNSKEKNGKKIASPEYIQLINKILNDRKTGIDQFGMVSDLNIFQENYALKTGTSRDYRDSWIIGYTPDFLVGVWVGNADVSPMDEVSGQIGAGKIWAKTMELLMNSEYNKKTPFLFDMLKEYGDGESFDYGLPNDNYEKYKNLLQDADTSLILLPHDGDVFLLEQNTKIILRAKEDVKWFVNNEFLGNGTKKIFIPQKTGRYQIIAENHNGKKEIISIIIN